jgi:hypothetical protein
MLSLFTVIITAKNMDTSGVYYVNTTLVSYMYTAAKVRTKTAESPKQYQIPIHTVFDLLKGFQRKQVCLGSSAAYRRKVHTI